MKEIILLSMTLFSVSSLASDSGTLTIKGTLTNYNECTFDKIGNEMKCTKKTAYKKIDKKIEINSKNEKKISTFYVY